MGKIAYLSTPASLERPLVLEMVECGAISWGKFTPCGTSHIRGSLFSGILIRSGRLPTFVELYVLLILIIHSRSSITSEVFRMSACAASRGEQFPGIQPTGESDCVSREGVTVVSKASRLIIRINRKGCACLVARAVVPCIPAAVLHLAGVVWCIRLL